MNKVKVTADAAGNVIAQCKSNSEYGFVRVQQNRFVVNEQGFAKKTSLSALILGTVLVLQAMSLNNGQELEGKIVIKESLSPFNKKEPKKDLKVAGETGIVCTYEGQVIYRKYFYTNDMSAQDVLISHTNKEEIKMAYAALKEEAKSLES
jgi:hypothetical protein